MSNTRITLCDSCKGKLEKEGHKFKPKPPRCYIACGICRNCNKKTQVDTYEPEMKLNYDELPNRGKIASDGEKVKNHGITACGGRCYVFYDENRQYHVECEKCGTLITYKARSLDYAIKLWNDMPDALGV